MQTAEVDAVMEQLVRHIQADARTLMADEGRGYQGLADRLGVAKSEAWKIVNQTPNLRLATIARLSIALGTTPHLSLSPCEDCALCETVGEGLGEGQ